MTDDEGLAPQGAATFRGEAQMYDRYIGRYGPALAADLIERAGVRAGMTVVEIGAGPGALTGALVGVVGADRVHAVEPSRSYAEACRERYPDVDLREGRGEVLPFADRCADAVLSQLVVNFLEDPHRAMAEQVRVARPGAVVAGSVWDYAERMTLLRWFWDAAAPTSTGSGEVDERRVMRCTSQAELRDLWMAAGLENVVVQPVDVTATWSSFDEMWSAVAAGVGPSGAWTAGLDRDGRDELRAAFYERLGSPRAGFQVTSGAWCALGHKPGR